MGEMASPTTQRERDYYRDEKVREQVEDAITTGHVTAVALQPHGFDGWGAVDGMYGELAGAFPDQYGCEIPEAGAWILVKKQPHTVLPPPPLYSMWFARPVYAARKFKVSVDRRRRWISWPMLKARIKMADGELDLIGGEFTVVSDMRPFLEMLGEGVDVHFVGPEPDEVAERLFYMRAHGLRAHEALAFALPDLEDADYVYLTLDLEGAP